MISCGITPASIDIEFCKGCIYLFHELDSWFCERHWPDGCKTNHYLQDEQVHGNMSVRGTV
jgi:hypothetical protein